MSSSAAAMSSASAALGGDDGYSSASSEGGFGSESSTGGGVIASTKKRARSESDENSFSDEEDEEDDDNDGRGDVLNSRLNTGLGGLTSLAELERKSANAAAAAAAAAATRSVSKKNKKKKKKLRSPPLHQQQQQQEDADDGNNASSRGHRKDKTLALLTSKFVEYLKEAPGGLLDLGEVSEKLEVKKRRVYDVINVLEGCQLVRKTTRSKIQWCGPFPLRDIPSMDTSPAATTTRTIRPSPSDAEPPPPPSSSAPLSPAPTSAAKVRELSRYTSLTQSEEKLDEGIERCMKLLKHTKAYVGTEHITGFFPDKTVLCIQRPDLQSTTTVKVHAPFDDRITGKRLHQISVKQQQPGGAKQKKKTKAGAGGLGVGVIAENNRLVQLIVEEELEPPAAEKKQYLTAAEVSACQLFLPDYDVGSLAPASFQDINMTQDTVGTISSIPLDDNLDWA